jgi:hypothetical protein
MLAVDCAGRTALDILQDTAKLDTPLLLRLLRAAPEIAGCSISDASWWEGPCTGGVLHWLCMQSDVPPPPPPSGS